MPAFDVNPTDPSKNRRPFVHVESAGDVTKQSAQSSYAEQGGNPAMTKLKMKGLAGKLREKNKLAIRKA